CGCDAGWHQKGHRRSPVPYPLTLRSVDSRTEAISVDDGSPQPQLVTFAVAVFVTPGVRLAHGHLDLVLQPSDLVGGQPCRQVAFCDVGVPEDAKRWGHVIPFRLPEGKRNSHSPSVTA